jgi:tRNA pseudouridine38-40 synthase
MFKLTLAYDGTGFVGWQRQASGRSIQGTIEDALRELDGRPVAVAGAGRTDAGVHALGQVASFSLERSMAPDALVRALNARLPEQVRALSAAAVADDFHARFGARAKRYRYRIWNADLLDPFERQYAWHVVGRLDVDRMEAAARYLEGRHDFAAFQAAGGATRTTEREVHASRITTEVGSALITYEVSGNGFLRHMVRTIVGTLNGCAR